MVVEKRKATQYWLLKTEPSEWSWDDQKSNGGISQWDGVTNRQAQNNMKSMRPGDFCFFYHSGGGSGSRCVVGVVEVVKPWYECEAGGGAVDVKEVGEMKRKVGLKEMKAEPELKGFVLLKQPRLSVVPVDGQFWEKICEMGGGYGTQEEAEEEEEEEGGGEEKA